MSREKVHEGLKITYSVCKENTFSRESLLLLEGNKFLRKYEEVLAIQYDPRNPKHLEIREALQRELTGSYTIDFIEDLTSTLETVMLANYCQYRQPKV